MKNPTVIHRIQHTDYIPANTKFTFSGTLIELYESIQHLLYLHAEAYEYSVEAVQEFPHVEEILLPEQCCYLLGKYYGITQVVNIPSGIEINRIDLNAIWHWYWFTDPEPDVHTDLADCLLNPELMAGIYHRRYKPGLASEVYALTLHGFDAHEYDTDFKREHWAS